MGPEKEIERMRVALSSLSKRHKELRRLFWAANDDLWAIEIALEEEASGHAS